VGAFVRSYLAHRPPDLKTKGRTEETMNRIASLMRHRWICAVLLVTATVSGPASAQTPANNSRPTTDSALQRLEREIARLAKGAGGVVGVSATHLESNRRVSLYDGERFPMASTFKVPVAVELLTRVDRGEIRLDQMIHLQSSDLHPGAGILTDLLNQPGLALSVRNLMELMLLISDNSATDVCLRLVGGPEAVTARMRALGIEGS
jgi:beta-lactamase class A